MKKLMILAAAAMVASFANASAFKWNTSITASASDTVMMFSAADYATITAYFADAKGDVASYLASKALDNQTLNGRGALAAAATVNPAVTDPGYFWVIFDTYDSTGKTTSPIAVGTGYIMTGKYGAAELADYLYDPAAASTPTTLALKAAQFTDSGTITAQDVPEPTSGLLLVLGLAGLALRRRRA